MPYELVVIPEQAVIPDEAVQRLEAWVRAGGRLLTSGTTIRSAAIQRLAGIRLEQAGALNDGHVLPVPGEEPTGVNSDWDRVSLAEAKELHPLYLSWDQFNPECRNLCENWPMHGVLDEENPQLAGMPAVTLREVGKGLVVHVATDLFTKYAALGDPQMLRWIRILLDRLQGDPWFRTDVPQCVEVSLRRRDSELLVHFVNGNPGRDVALLRTDDLWVDDIPALAPFTCWVRLPARPASVTREPGAEAVNWTWSDGTLAVTVPRLEIHTCLRVMA
jgi:hypothetical protein